MSDMPPLTTSSTSSLLPAGEPALPLPQQSRYVALPRPSPQHLKQEVDRLERQPFARVLSNFLACEPNAKAIRLAAKRSPDRWVQSLTQLARLAGYHDKLELDVELSRVTDLSDAELETRITRVLANAELSHGVSPYPLVETAETTETDETPHPVQPVSTVSPVSHTDTLSHETTPSETPYTDVAVVPSTDGDQP